MSAATLSPVASVDLREVIDRLWDVDALIALMQGYVAALLGEDSNELARALDMQRELLIRQVNELDGLATNVEQAEGIPADSPAIKPTSER